MNIEYTNIGSDFDDFLEEEGILYEVEATAIKRVIAFQIAQERSLTIITNNFLTKQIKIE